MKKAFLFVVVVLSLSGCASFSISNESFVGQLQNLQNIKRTGNVISIGTNYDANSIEKIKCIDKNGNEVWLSGGKDVNFEITKLSTGKSVSLYFDTVYYKNDTIYGLKSRIVGGKRAIAVQDISKVVIKAEQAITEKVQ